MSITSRLERRITRSLIETQARLFFTSWLEHQVLKTVLKVVSLPVTGPYQSAKWMFEKIHEEVEGERTDEERVKGRLMELQLRYELEEVEEAEYLEQEKVLMEDLAAITASKKDEQYEPDEAWWRRTFPEGFAEEQE
ncbi:MAG: gas vesicle protein GvpG [Anaerolineae bacterium]|nr:gas vesicle protein GvpG [Anaerolineae bacterium]